MIRIGRIAYANCTPIFSAFQECHPDVTYQFISGVPAQLNAMLSAGDIDVCPSSSFEYAYHSEQYCILPQLSISSITAVGSVLLFSRIPLEELNGCKVLLSSESATSVNLLRILLGKRFGFNCSYTVHQSGLEEALAEAPALLLIGDSALRESLHNPSLYKYDLGQLWTEWTGLPFVFALWLCRRETAIANPEEVARLAEELVASKAHALRNLQSIAEQSTDADWMGVDRLAAYWRENISYDLGDLHLEGLRLFFRYCAESGLLERAPELHFFSN